MVIDGAKKEAFYCQFIESSIEFDTHFYMIAKPNGLLLILLTHSISYFLQKNVSDFCFVRLSSFFAHKLFTNLQYDKTIKNNNRFLIDFFHTFLSFETGFMSVSFLSIKLKLTHSL